MTLLELVTYDPTDGDTYPSVCCTARQVEKRFGFVGGETLVFDVKGGYVGQLVHKPDGGVAVDKRGVSDGPTPSG